MAHNPRFPPSIWTLNLGKNAYQLSKKKKLPHTTLMKEAVHSALLSDPRISSHCLYTLHFPRFQQRIAPCERDDSLWRLGPQTTLKRVVLTGDTHPTVRKTGMKILRELFEESLDEHLLVGCASACYDHM
jgi:hypothetical protein